MPSQLDMTIRVNVELSENTQNFIASIVEQLTKTSATIKSRKVQAPKEQPAEQPKSERQSASTPVNTLPVDDLPVSAPQESTSEKPSNVTIADLREMLLKKVDNNREAIKDKLSELGSPSVTKLGEEHYEQFYQFLKAL